MLIAFAGFNHAQLIAVKTEFAAEWICQSAAGGQGRRDDKNTEAAFPHFGHTESFHIEDTVFQKNIFLTRFQGHKTFAIHQAAFGAYPHKSAMGNFAVRAEVPGDILPVEGKIGQSLIWHDIGRGGRPGRSVHNSFCGFFQGAAASFQG